MRNISKVDIAHGWDSLDLGTKTELNKQVCFIKYALKTCYSPRAAKTKLKASLNSFSNVFALF